METLYQVSWPLLSLRPNRCSNSSELDFVNWSIAATHLNSPHRQLVHARASLLAITMFADCGPEKIRFWGQSATARVAWENRLAYPQDTC